MATVEKQVPIFEWGVNHIINKPSDKQLNGNIFWVAVVLAPPLAYFTAYRFEEGYAHYFGISSHLISIEITRVIYAIIALISLFVFILYLIWLSNIIYMPLSQHIHRHVKGSIWRRIKKLFPVWALFCFAVYSVGFKAEAYLLLAIALVFSFFEFIFPLIIKTPGANYAEKLENQENADKNTVTTVTLLFRSLGSEISKWLVFALIIYTSINIIAFFLGVRDARTTDNFLVTNEKEERVVLRIYGDRIILAPFDRSEKVVYPEFSIMSLLDLELVLKEEEVGPLRLFEIKSTVTKR